MDKEEYEEIKKLCDDYGYAAIMMMTSALWRRDFKNNGFNTNGVLYPIEIDGIKEEVRNKLTLSLEHYDKMIDRFESNR